MDVTIKFFLKKRMHESHLSTNSLPRLLLQHLLKQINHFKFINNYPTWIWNIFQIGEFNMTILIILQRYFHIIISKRMVAINKYEKCYTKTEHVTLFIVSSLNKYFWSNVPWSATFLTAFFWFHWDA